MRRLSFAVDTLVGIAASENKKKRASELNEDGIELANAYHYEKALYYFQEAHKLMPSNPTFKRNMQLCEQELRYDNHHVNEKFSSDLIEHHNYGNKNHNYNKFSDEQKKTLSNKKKESELDMKILKREMESKKRKFLNNWDYKSLLKFQKTFTDANYEDKQEIIQYIDNKFNYDAFFSRKNEMNTPFKIDNSLGELFKDDPDVLKYEYTCGKCGSIYANSLTELKTKVNELGLPLDLSDVDEIESNKNFTINIPTKSYSNNDLFFKFPEYYVLGNITEDMPDYCKIVLAKENDCEKVNDCEIYICLFEEDSPYRPPNNEIRLKKYLVESGYSSISLDKNIPLCFNAVYKNFELGTISAKIFFRFDCRRVVMVVGNVLEDINYDCSRDLEIISKKLKIHEPPVQEIKKEKRSIINRFFKKNQ